MSDPLEEAYEGVLMSVYAGAEARAEMRPDEPLAINTGIAFELGVTLALCHPEYARAIATQFNEQGAQRFMASAMVLGNPIVRKEVEEQV